MLAKSLKIGACGVSFASFGTGLGAGGVVLWVPVAMASPFGCEHSPAGSVSWWTVSPGCHGIVSLTGRKCGGIVALSSARERS